MRPSILLLAAALLPACSTTDTIINAPNHGVARDRVADSSQAWLSTFGIDREMRVDVGPPDASIVLWIIEPKAEGRTALQAVSPASKEVTGKDATACKAVLLGKDATACKAVLPSRGTILVLHGFGDGAFWMLGKARDLSAAGFRTVLVTQRGYGQSTGDYRTYGVVEKRDLSQVIDALQREKLCGDTVGVWGMSYGAAMALELAGHDDRVKAVVAVAGFSSMRAIVPRLIATRPPFTGLTLTPEQRQIAIDEAAAAAGFNADEADATKAIAKTKAAVLLAHGQCDLVVPYENAQRLLAAADPTRTELLTLPLATHVTIWFDVDGAVAQRSREWFGKWLAE